MISKQQPPLRGSQTMPQLHYTREDIQEQYQRVRPAEPAGTKRARSGCARGHASPPAHSSSSEPEEEEEAEAEEAGEGRGRAARRSSRKRRRRARSAALFSACFHIPHLLAPTGGAPAGRQRRSLLAQLGLGPRAGQANQRPLSASQTTGDLQRASRSDRHAAPGARKHVSFGGPSGAAPEQPSGTPTAGAAAANQLRHQQVQPEPRTSAGGFADAGRGNNVIMRNYRAHQPPAQEGKASKQSPILAYVSAGETARQSPMFQRPAANQQRPASQVQAQVQQPQAVQPQRPTHMQMQRSHIQGSSSSAPIRQQPLAGGHQPAAQTIYKRLPAVPMRTQATQTEITAYHLMATPSHSSASSRVRPAPDSDTLSSAAVSVTPEHSRQTVAAAQPIPEVPEAQRDDGSDEWSVDEDEPREGGAAPDDCGNLPAPALAFSSSRSSSSGSLEGHDSTLANTLHLGPETKGPSSDRQQPSSSTSITAVRDDALQLKLENDNKRAEARVGKTVSSQNEAEPREIEPPRQFKDGSVAATAEEPQQPAVDASTGSVGETTFMNMNSRERPRPEVPGAGPSVERAPSPPSLSEASSQTDAALAPYIRQLGRRLRSLPSAEAPAGLERQRRARLSGSAEQPSPELQRADLADDKVAIADESLCPLAPNEAADDEAADADDSGDELDDTELSGGVSTAALPDSQPASTNSSTNRPAEFAAAVAEELDSCPSDSDKIITDNGRDPNRRLSVEPSSLQASQRRDDFLQLGSSGELLEPEPPQEPGNEMANESTKRSTTSTLSTRHHSYCSTDDFQSTHHDSNQPEVAVEALGKSGGSIISSSAAAAQLLQQQFQRRSMEEIGEADPDWPAGALTAGSSGEAPDADECTRVPARTAACPLDLVAIGADLEAAAAANGPDKPASGGNIKLDCGAGGRFMIAGGYKNLDERQDVEGKVALEAELNDAMAASLSSQVLAEATQELAAGAEPASPFSSRAASRSEPASSASSTWSGSSSGASGAAVASPARGGSGPAAAEPPLEASPPTTVSELDQDEELSMPSFVDSYRQRLEQSVRQLADSLIGNLLAECLSGAGGQQRVEPEEEGRGQLATLEEERGRQTEPDEERGSSSSQSTSTTSASGRSYECCHPKSPEPAPRPSRPPPLPAKPAHLRARVECAAAVAVTTTSIAAAAVLHTGCQPVGVRQPAPVELLAAESLEDHQICKHQQQRAPEEPDASERPKPADAAPEPTRTPSSDGSALVSRSGSAASVVPSGSGQVALELPELDEESRTDTPEGAQQSASSLSTGELSANSRSLSSSRRVNVDESPSRQQPSEPDETSFTSSEALAQQQPIVQHILLHRDEDEPSEGAAVELVRRTSQELSTVSEVSEEMSPGKPVAAVGFSARGRKPEVTSSATSRALGELPALVAQAPTSGACGAALAELGTTTEQDLAQSEYSLHSQGSEVGALLSETQDVSGQANEALLQRARQASLAQSSPGSSAEEQRRRSGGSSATNTCGNALVSTAATGSASGSHSRAKAAAVDCPYVHDIVPLSPDARVASPSNQAILVGVACHPKRLSHDDTMEAIEDDIEGEEQELAAAEREPATNPQLVPPPPPPFGQSDSVERTYTPAESIKEEEEEEEESEGDEESSISVSQQHGVVISQEVPARQSSSASSTPHTPTAGGARHQPEAAPAELDDEVADSAAAALEAQQALVSLSLEQAKSLSTESATTAILAHLSRHHQELTMEEPLPSPSLEPSRSVDPAQRRESWRRESSFKRQPVAAPSSSCDEPVDNSTATNTGTMKRKPRPQSMDEPPVPEQQAAPPKAAPAKEQVARQVSSSLPTDSSICSSCSCLETTYSSEQPPAAALQNPAAGSSKAAATTSVLDGRKAWMSQEEGTVFTENYWLAHWLYISEHEEAEIWRRAIDMNPPPVSSDQQTPSASDKLETASTTSERNFSCKYKSTTRKMIHRRASIEMYRRIMNDALKREKRVEISRSNGEFGFRIHGSRPVVVSAIERGTSAETCGLQVGDLIYAINGTNILDMAHSEVVKLAHSADSSALVLDLVPTNGFLRMSKYSRANNKHYEPTVTGFLLRLSPSTAQPLLINLQERMANVTGVSSQQRANKVNEVMRLAWRQRYYVLRSDNCLYWYRSPTDIEPYGGLNLQGFSASLTNEFSEPSYVIRLVRYGGQPHYLGTNNICDIQTWVDAINKAATEANQDDPYMKRTLTLARSRPSLIPEPDCAGYLHKFSHKRGGGAHWRPAYLVLKDACLYLFRDQQAETVEQASAVYYLHGYRIRNKHIEHKKHTFELIPPNRKTIRPMFLMASSEIDRKRWIAAFEYSIDRWIEID